MSFADAAGRMRDRQYATFGVAVIWTPAGGDPATLTGIARLGDEDAQVEGLSMMRVTAVTAVRLRVSEVAALDIGAPQPNDAISVDGVAFRVLGEPKLMDQRRAEYTVALAPGP
jgi:hypothetical protein